ncbi:MAG: hypothetical protein ACOCUA_03220 [archaeon]
MSERKVCPECGEVGITPKTDRGYGTQRQYDTAYRCKNADCGAHFDEPAYREVERQGPTHGLAAELAARGEQGGTD